VRFTARKDIHESLTGRLVDIELIPFVLSELHHRELPRFVVDLLSKDSRSVIEKIKPIKAAENRKMIEQSASSLVF
jgi:hypothetical protein